MQDRELLAINSQNWHGLGQGVDPEVAKDLGQTPFDEMDELPAGIKAYRAALDSLSTPVAVESPQDDPANPYADATPVENPGLNTGVNNAWNQPLSPAQLRAESEARDPEEQAAIEATYARAPELARATYEAARAKKRQNG